MAGSCREVLLGGGYSYIMTGNPAASLIVSTYMKGLLTKADPVKAFEIIKRNQMPGGMLGGGPGGRPQDVEFYIKKGWWPGNAGITIEAAFQDWGAAQMAQKLGKKKDYNLFHEALRELEELLRYHTEIIIPQRCQWKIPAQQSTQWRRLGGSQCLAGQLWCIA